MEKIASLNLDDGIEVVPTKEGLFIHQEKNSFAVQVHWNQILSLLLLVQMDSLDEVKSIRKKMKI